MNFTCMSSSVLWIHLIVTLLNCDCIVLGFPICFLMLVHKSLMSKLGGLEKPLQCRVLTIDKK